MRYLLAATAALCVASSASAAVLVDTTVTFTNTDEQEFYLPLGGAGAGRYTIRWSTERAPQGEEWFVIAAHFGWFAEWHFPDGGYHGEFIDVFEPIEEVSRRSGGFSFVVPEPIFESYDGYSHRREFYALGVRANGGIDTDPVTFRITVTQSTVPEPAAWAIMIIGFGLVGAALRRQPRANPAPF